ncbi:MAG: metallophosphoesterase [Actinobacteria bacterium]|nr:metallophosphoesterase [Actinomycetota bacterium]
MHRGGTSYGGRLRGFTAPAVRALTVLFVALATMYGCLSGPGTGATAEAAFHPEGSLPEVAKRINQLIYPTFGCPAILPRGEELVIEWDWRKSVAANPRPELAQVDRPQDWEVWITTSVAANVRNYDGSVPGEAENPPEAWYRYGGPSYGTYERPVHRTVNTRRLPVKGVSRGPSRRWPEIFGQAAFEVDHIEVALPVNVPLDLYDVHVRCVSDRVGPGFLVEDAQPHALQVIESFGDDLKIVHITDTHVYGPEIKNGLNLDYNSFELREPRPGTPPRIDLGFLGYPGFPMDLDGDGKRNEGAIYLQEELQAINLMDPDFVVFTGDSVFAQKNFNTYPKDTLLWGDVNGDPGTEYRFEYTWWYDELLALNVPVFCVPGNHDSYCWDGHEAAHDDGQEIWQDLFGPLYYSWDYGDMTFLAVNSMDWDKMDADGPEPFTPQDMNPLLWAVAVNLYPEMAQDYDDRNGFLVDLHRILLPLRIITPHKWHGQVRGGGDPWDWQAWPWGPDPGEDGFDGQLAWIEGELARAEAEGKRLKGVFLHHDPLRPAGAPPETWDNTKEFGLLELSAGQGEGSQALMYLLRRHEVAFVASGHTHSDAINAVDWEPYGDGPGRVVSINTTGAEPPVDGKSLLMDKTSENYGGYRLITIRDGELREWGFAGAGGDAERRWSIPGWEGLRVGAGAVNGYDVYRTNRPVLQWMEQEDSSNPAYRRPHIVNGEGAFDRPLPLDGTGPGGTGPYDDVTCKVKNTLAQPGAVLDLSGCRIEFPMRRLSGGGYYAAQNGTILEQYDTDSGLRMVVVKADVPGGSVLPVRVYAAGSDGAKPVVDEASVNGGASTVPSLDVTLTLRAHDEGAGLMDLRVSNRRDFAGAEWIPCRDGKTVTLPWRLAGGLPGKRRVYVQFRDAAMPGNVRTVSLTVRYLPSG